MLTYRWKSGLLDAPLDLPSEDSPIPDILVWFWYSKSNPDMIMPYSDGLPIFEIDPHPFDAEPPWHFEKPYSEEVFETRAGVTAWACYGEEWVAPGPTEMEKVVYEGEHFEGGKYWYEFTTEIYGFFGRNVGIKGMASASSMILLIMMSMLSGGIYPCRRKQT